MWLICGVRLPMFALPAWMSVLGSLLPLTTSIAVVRGALTDGQGLIELLPELGVLAGFSALLIVATAVILRVGEARAQNTGQLRLF
jgi:ABC-2 type transport system permease protein